MLGGCICRKHTGAEREYEVRAIHCGDTALTVRSHPRPFRTRLSCLSAKRQHPVGHDAQELWYAVGQNDISDICCGHFLGALCAQVG